MKLLGKRIAAVIAFASLAAPAAALACDEDDRRVEYNRYEQRGDYGRSYNDYQPRVQVYLPRPYVPQVVYRPLWREARWERRWQGRHGYHR